jgi:hypothetical protein
MNESTTILFVPGAWHSPDCYDPVVQRLEAAKYKTSKVHLASVNPPTHYLDFSEDIAHIHTQWMQGSMWWWWLFTPTADYPQMRQLKDWTSRLASKRV